MLLARRSVGCRSHRGRPHRPAHDEGGRPERHRTRSTLGHYARVSRPSPATTRSGQLRRGTARLSAGRPLSATPRVIAMISIAAEVRGRCWARSSNGRVVRTVSPSHGHARNRRRTTNTQTCTEPPRRPERRNDAESRRWTASTPSTSTTTNRVSRVSPVRGEQRAGQPWAGSPPVQRPQHQRQPDRLGRHVPQRDEHAGNEDHEDSRAAAPRTAPRSRGPPPTRQGRPRAR